MKQPGESYRSTQRFFGSPDRFPGEALAAAENAG
jgi:hypothetical protein